MIIKHPRRLLVIGSPACDLGALVKGLTSTEPQKDSTGSIAGSLHSWSLKTDYYSTEIPIWIDEIRDLDEWQAEFSKSEAKEVVQALGGWICCIPKASGSDDEISHASTVIKAVNDVINKACGHSWDGLKLLVALSTPSSTVESRVSLEDWEDVCMEYGFEYVDADATGKNEFGERLGLDRIREAVEANEWHSVDDELSDDGESGGFGAEQAEMNAELWGLKASLLQDEEEDGLGNDDIDERDQVENLEDLVNQALAIKEHGANLSAEERKKYAARAVNELMRDM